jgi:hypothetical protein
MRLPVALLLVITGCSRAASSPGADAAPPVDAGHGAGHDAVADAAPPPCFPHPQTYLQIINACTDAQAVDKKDDLSPMNLADGGLQPLP